MQFKLYREYGALNSRPIFDAFEQGLTKLGHRSVSSGEDVSVIWSVLWAGRMLNNRKIYESALRSKKPVIIIEVGNFYRGKTWRISLNHVNSLGVFGNDSNLDPNRAKFLGVDLKPLQTKRRGEILLAGQHESSLQWQGLPPAKRWTESMIAKIKQYTNRRIIVRPHPRSPFSINLPGVVLERSQKIPNTYDDYNIFYNYHCVVNYNSGPGVQAAINGVPVWCDQSSLAGPMSINLENIDNPILPDREDWFLKLCHTEWTVEEIAQGIPLQRLMPFLS